MILTGISASNGVLGAISFIGSLILTYMGYSNLKADGSAIAAAPGAKSTSLKKGILVNLTNPHPYLMANFI